MVASVQPVKPIGRGYPYPLRVRVDGEVPVFPAGISLRADVHNYVGAQARAGTLSTAEGSIERIDDNTIDLTLSKEMTAALANNNLAVLDLVRIVDGADDWMGIRVEIPVEFPITEPMP